MKLFAIFAVSVDGEVVEFDGLTARQAYDKFAVYAAEGFYRVEAYRAGEIIARIFGESYAARPEWDAIGA